MLLVAEPEDDANRENEQNLLNREKAKAKKKTESLKKKTESLKKQISELLNKNKMKALILKEKEREIIRLKKQVKRLHRDLRHEQKMFVDLATDRTTSDSDFE